MTSADQPLNGHAPDAVDQLRHVLKAPLTAISGRAQLLTRIVHRSPTLSVAECDRMLEGLAAIEEAVQHLVVVIDGIVPADSSRDGHRPIE